ncbi:hypothetical protein MYO4S_00157 [Serratia phage 4S]|nr:hypothetical protein MYO4S_00157 [Serratia phage 4S]
MKPVIATDVDGILVKWQSGLPYFMAKYNIPTKNVLDIMVNDRFVEAEELFGCNATLAKTLMNEYNNSDFIKYLAPYTDAIGVINRMKEHYDFVAITALGTTSEAQLNRMFNLNALFPGAFKDVLCVNYGESKIPHYLDIKIKYKERLVCFVDDLAYNLEDCHSVISELPLVWMPRQDYGRKPDCFVNRVHDWNELEEKILSDNLVIYPAPVLGAPKDVKEILNASIEL